MSSMAVTPGLGQVIELLFDTGEGSFRTECADVQLIDHGFVPGPAAPVSSSHSNAAGSMTSLGP